MPYCIGRFYSERLDYLRQVTVACRGWSRAGVSDTLRWKEISVHVNTMWTAIWRNE